MMIKISLMWGLPKSILFLPYIFYCECYLAVHIIKDNVLDYNHIYLSFDYIDISVEGQDDTLWRRKCWWKSNPTKKKSDIQARFVIKPWILLSFNCISFYFCFWLGLIVCLILLVLDSQSQSARVSKGSRSGYLRIPTREDNSSNSTNKQYVLSYKKLDSLLEDEIGKSGLSTPQNISGSYYGSFLPSTSSKSFNSLSISFIFQI